MRDKMLAYMAARKLCVISTVGRNAKPESAMVAYTNNGLELFIGTSSQSRKFQNLLTNSSVAVVIADEEGEVQYEGEAQLLEAEHLADEAVVNKLPGFEKYRTDPTQVYFHVKPTWIRYIEHGDPDRIEEFTEF